MLWINSCTLSWINCRQNLTLARSCASFSRILTTGFRSKKALASFYQAVRYFLLLDWRNRVPTHKQVSEYLASSYTTMAIVTKKITDNKKTTRLSVFLTCNNFLTLHNSWIALISPLKSHSSISPPSNRKPFAIKRGFTTNQLPLRIEWWEVQERKRGGDGKTRKKLLTVDDISCSDC